MQATTCNKKLKKEVFSIKNQDLGFLK